MVSNRKARRLVTAALIERNILRTLRQSAGKIPYTHDGHQLIKKGLEREFFAVTYDIEYKDPKDDV